MCSHSINGTFHSQGRVIGYSFPQPPNGQGSCPRELRTKAEALCIPKTQTCHTDFFFKGSSTIPKPYSDHKTVARVIQSVICQIFTEHLLCSGHQDTGGKKTVTSPRPHRAAVLAMETDSRQNKRGEQHARGRQAGKKSKARTRKRVRDFTLDFFILNYLH